MLKKRYALHIFFRSKHCLLVQKCTYRRFRGCPYDPRIPHVNGSCARAIGFAFKLVCTKERIVSKTPGLTAFAVDRVLPQDTRFPKDLRGNSRQSLKQCHPFSTNGWHKIWNILIGVFSISVKNNRNADSSAMRCANSC